MYTIENLKGTRVVKRRKVESDRPAARAAKDEPKLKRVVKRRVPPPAAKPVAKPERVKSKKAVAPKSYPSGQSGPQIDLAVADLNNKEHAVLTALNGEGRGERPELTIAATAAAAFARESQARGNSWVRNSLRRLVRAGYVERTDRGCYRVTDSGRRRLAKAA
jgi:hypothetical protein